MTPTPEVQERLRRYLLGQLADNVREEIENNLLTDDELFEELLVAEDELIDDYLSGKLKSDDRTAFEQHFLATPERRDMLKFGRAFDRYLSSQVTATPGVQTKPSPKPWAWTQAFYSSPIRIGAFAIVIVAIALGVWRVFFVQSEVEKGLLALNSAYREQRPVESRISALSYARFSETRGPDDLRVDALARDRAELILNHAATDPGDAAAHHALGQVFLAKQDFDRAIREFELAHSGGSNDAKLYSDLGAAWLEKGKLDRDRQPGKGMEAMGRSLENLNKALEVNPNLLEALFNRALAYQYMMASREAQSSWKQYIERDPNSPWTDEARRNLKQLEESHEKTSWNSGKALQDFLAAREQRNDDAAWRVITHSYISGGNEVTNTLLDMVINPSVQTSVRDPAAALSYLGKLELERATDRYTYDLVRQLARDSPKQRQIRSDARGKMRAAHDLFTTSQYKPALAIYSETKRQYDEIGDLTGRLLAEYRLAYCHLFLNDLKQAELIFKRLSDICLARGYHRLAAQCFYGLSHANYDRSRYSKAIEYSRQALTHFERAGDLNGVVKALTQLAQANQVLNRIDRALIYLNKALMLTTDIPTEPMAKWGMLLQAAFDMSAQNLHQAALAYLKEALEVALKMERPLIISRSYDYLASEYAAVKRYADAVDAAKRAMATGEAMPRNSGLEIIGHAAQQLGDIHRQSGECRKALQDYDKSIDIYRQLKVEYYGYGAHKGKLVCFIADKDDQAAAGELPLVLSLFDEYRSKITDENQRASFFAHQQSVYDLAIYYASVRRRDSRKAFDYSEESRARILLDEIRRGARVLKKNDEPEVNLPTVTRSLSLSEIQQKMPLGSQILQYAVLDDRVLIWVVTRTEFHEVSVESNQINQTVRAFLESVNKPAGDNSNAYAKPAEGLYRILIAPVERFLDRSKYLCIVPDKILNYVPYQALVSPTASRFLIEDYAVGIAPSATTFIDLSESAQQKSGAFEEHLLSVGDPHLVQADFDYLAELKSAAREAQSVSRFYPNNHLLLRDDATESAVRAQIQQSDVAHFAMHYVVNDQIETLSGFPLTPDERNPEKETSNGFLQSYEIYSLNLRRTRLVVLSGCQTGIEQHYAGEGAIGAARPFFIAGVPTAVATLWPVDSEASADLMTRFHRHRREASAVALSLHRAQIEMARGEDSRYRHPYYWAGFQTIGGLSSY